MNAMATDLRIHTLDYRSVSHQYGFSMMEVLVSIVIVSIGLLGLASLQSRMQMTNMEAYQRSQAILLLQDMANRINANRANVSSYASQSVGTNASYSHTGCTTSIATQDLCDWDSSLLGAAEVDSSNNKVGVMIGARGCTSAVTTDATTGYQQIMLTVAWQGLGPTKAPPNTVTCGQGQYNTGTGCVNDLCRRVLTTTVTIAKLS